MGTFTVSITGDVSVGTLSKTYNISDADINRLVTWAKLTFRSGMGNGGPSTAIALRAWFDDFMARSSNSVVLSETQKLTPPPPIVAS